MNVLLLYNSTQTYTNTVFEHLKAFARFSSNRYFFCHHDVHESFDVDLSRFDAIVVHYCVRLPFDEIAPAAAERIAAFQGLKALFIQDEYDNTHRTWSWIKRLGIQLVFTVVPAPHIEQVYPSAEFPGVRFVSNLTGYVPEELPTGTELAPTSCRPLVVGYRARELPVRYGLLPREKVEVAQLVKRHCEQRGIQHDVAWTEESRIYGPAWYEFVASCRSMLGSESGSNVFDWDGHLQEQISLYRQQHPSATEQDVYAAVVAQHEMPGVMNQISPRIFEAIGFRTALVLFEGSYSGVVEPWKHFIPLRKDGGNLDEVFAFLADPKEVDALTERAYRDVIASGRYSYPQFIRWVDEHMRSRLDELAQSASVGERLAAPIEYWGAPTALSSHPARSRPAGADAGPPAPDPLRLWRNLAVSTWQYVPEGVRPVLKPVVRQLLLPSLRLARRAVARWRQ